MARPKDTFLVASYLKAPKNPAKTHFKGYMTDDKNVSYREKVTVTRGLKDRDLTAPIILNLTQKTVFKCLFDGKNDWENLAKYYANAYPNYFNLIDPPKEVEEVEELEGDLVVPEGEDTALEVGDLAEEK